MEKETLKEVQKEISSLTKKLNVLYKKRDMIKTMNHDYRGKYLYHNNYGYIYVQSQYVDEEYLVLQGFVFYYSFSPYNDDFYYKVDALQDWRIRINSSFKDEVKEITKEKFIKDFNKGLNELKEKTPEMFSQYLNSDEL